MNMRDNRSNRMRMMAAMRAKIWIIQEMLEMKSRNNKRG